MTARDVPANGPSSMSLGVGWRRSAASEICEVGERVSTLLAQRVDGARGALGETVTAFAAGACGLLAPRHKLALDPTPALMPDGP